MKDLKEKTRETQGEVLFSPLANVLKRRENKNR